MSQYTENELKELLTTSTHPSLVSHPINMNVSIAQQIHEKRVHALLSKTPEEVNDLINHILPVVKTPYTKLNETLGTLGGFKRGELVVFVSEDPSDSQQIIEDITVGHALVNAPVMIDSSKAPTVFSFSFTGTIPENQTRMLKRYREVTGDTESIDYPLFRKNGYQYLSYVTERPSEYTLDDLFNIVIETEQEGHEMHLVTIGDLSTINPVDKEGQITSLGDIYIRVRKFFASRGCVVITSLPTNSTVELFTTTDPAEKLKAISRFGTYRSGGRIALYVDSEIIVNNTGTEFHIYCGKHRGCMLTINNGVLPLGDDGFFVFDEPLITE